MGNRTGNDLSEIKENLQRATLYEGYIVALCPFHEDGHPSFFVNETYYNCVSPSCGANGETSFLLDKISGGESYSHTNRSPEVANPFRFWSRKYGSLEKAMQAGYATYKKFPFMMEYLLQRGITHETVKSLRIGWLDGWITFPFFDEQKKFIGATARTTISNAKYRNPVDQDGNIMYVPDWDMVQNSGIIYVPFGIVDAVSLYQCGIPTLTPTFGIKANSEPFSEFRKILKIIPDKWEQKTGAMLVSKLGWRGKLLNLDWPDDCKDINDVLRMYGQSKINDLLFEDEKTIIKSLGY